MATACGLIGKNGSSHSWVQLRDRISRTSKSCAGRTRNTKGVNVSCSLYSSSVMDPYKTLRIHPGASETEVKKAFRQLALQYHPDVCRGNNCGTQFHLINEAYDIVMSSLRGETDDDQPMATGGSSYYDQGIDEPCWGMNDPDWDMWEEWMGWEGAGIRDYSSHINPYI